MSTPIIELFSIPTTAPDVDWQSVITEQFCPYINKTCIKIRMSQPDIAIGTCTVGYGARDPQMIVICPQRLLERGQIFMDCLHLLTLHEPGNELHKIAEVEIPGGSVDYFLVSTQRGKVVDFVGIELQALDTTGTVWPACQHFLQAAGISVDTEPARPFGMNWKMTAKTTLVQLHHKIETFEQLGKHLVLVVQDVLMDYMRREFNFDHVQASKVGHTLHFHSYGLDDLRLQLVNRASTDATGMTLALGLQASPDVELELLIAVLESKLSDQTRLQI